MDSGTTLLRLPVTVFNALVDAITRSSLVGRRSAAPMLRPETGGGAHPPVVCQIQDFSSGFWDGSKLACWMKGETPWRFFPKLSLYLRASNSSQSFRITILPQVQLPLAPPTAQLAPPPLAPPTDPAGPAPSHPVLPSGSSTSSRSPTWTGRWTASASACPRPSTGW